MVTTILGQVRCPECVWGGDTMCETCGGSGFTHGYGKVEITEHEVLVIDEGFWPSERALRASHPVAEHLPFIRRVIDPPCQVEALPVRVQRRGAPRPDSGEYVLTCPHCGVRVGESSEAWLSGLDQNYLGVDLQLGCLNCKKGIKVVAEHSQLKKIEDV